MEKQDTMGWRVGSADEALALQNEDQSSDPQDPQRRLANVEASLILEPRRQKEGLSGASWLARHVLTLPVQRQTLSQ